MINWGPEIPCDGKRPDFVRDGDVCCVFDHMWVESGKGRTPGRLYWPTVTKFKLLASHPHYTKEPDMRKQVKEALDKILAFTKVYGVLVQEDRGALKSAHDVLAQALDMQSRSSMPIPKEPDMLNWNGPLEARHVDGRVVKGVTVEKVGIDGNRLAAAAGNRWYFRPNGTPLSTCHGWRIYNTEQSIDPYTVERCIEAVRALPYIKDVVEVLDRLLPKPKDPAAELVTRFKAASFSHDLRDFADWLICEGIVKEPEA